MRCRYTPTTESVRTSAVTISRLVNEAEFDRWLDQVRTKAWGECADMVANLGRLDEQAIPWLKHMNPYRRQEES